MKKGHLIRDWNPSQYTALAIHRPPPLLKKPMLQGGINPLYILMPNSIGNIPHAALLCMRDFDSRVLPHPSSPFPPPAGWDPEPGDLVCGRGETRRQLKSDIFLENTNRFFFLPILLLSGPKPWRPGDFCRYPSPPAPKTFWTRGIQSALIGAGFEMMMTRNEGG